MKIIGIKGENFKRMKSFEIHPGNENVIEVSGKNSQGKSSTIDAIWAALQGAVALKSTPKPVRKGADRAEITIDIGDYIVTRKFSADGNAYLTVTNAHGAKQKSPQALLDGLLGRLTFDPLAWCRMSDKDQAAAIMEMLKIDVSAIDRKRQSAYNKRTIVNGNVARLKAEIAAISDPTEQLPDRAIDTRVEMERQREMIAEVRHIESLESELKSTQTKIALCKAEADRQLKMVTGLEDVLCKIEIDLGECERPDLDSINNLISNAGRINSEIANRDKKIALRKSLKKFESESDNLGKEIESTAEEKRSVLAAAKMPVKGLAISEDDGMLFLNGVPLKQSSRSEQLRCAVGMAMAEHPELRVMRIEDASILDSDSMDIIREMASENDYQLWMEVVDDSGEVGVYIEDGEIAINNLKGEK